MSRLTNGCAALLSGACLLLASPVTAAELVEVRDFSIRLNGKQVGTSTMTIVDREDGSTVVTHRADVTARVLLISYTYKFQGVELWKDYQLQQTQGDCLDNGKRYSTSGERSGDGKTFNVRVNNEQRVVPADVWTTSYWKLPDKKFFNEDVPLLDLDTARRLAGQLNYVGEEKRVIAGKEMTCYHVHVPNEKHPVDVWFDIHHRQVRQEFVEQGYRTTIELVSIRRELKQR